MGKNKKKKREMKISQFSIFSCMWQVHPNTFSDITTRKCVISMYTYIYVKLRDIATQELPFLGFHIPNFRKVLWQTHFFTFSNTYNLPSFHYFGTGISSSRCWIFLFNQLALLILSLNIVKLWHQKK